MTEPDFAGARAVGSVDEEYRVVQSTSCACGGPVAVRGQSLLTDPKTGRKYDRLDAACARCGAARTFLFDINAFFGKSASPPTPKTSERGCLILIWVLALAAVVGSAIAWTRSAPVPGMIALGVAAFLVWIGWPAKRPAAAPPAGPASGSGDEMAETLAALGIPLDAGAGDPKDALVGGAAKAGIARGYRAMREGKKEEAIQGFTSTLSLLSDQTGPRWMPIRAVALRLRAKLLEESGRAADALADYDRVLAFLPEDPEAKAGKARLSTKPS